MKKQTYSNDWDSKKKKSKPKKRVAKENKIMDSIQALTNAVTDLQAQVILVLEALKTGVPSPAIQSAVDSINAETAKLKAAIPS